MTFIEKVIKMRDLQKKYFKYRDPLTLQSCKVAERDVDAELQKHVKQVREQPKLF
jgi:hypothetical protein